MSTDKKIIDLIVDRLSVDRANVTMEASIKDDLGGDSLDIIELIMACEDEFNIDIPDEDIERIKTVGDIIRYVERVS